MKPNDTPGADDDPAIPRLDTHVTLRPTPPDLIDKLPPDHPFRRLDAAERKQLLHEERELLEVLAKKPEHAGRFVIDPAGTARALLPSATTLSRALDALAAKVGRAKVDMGPVVVRKATVEVANEIKPHDRQRKAH